MKTYLCTAIVHVEDEPALLEYAEGRAQECWSTDLAGLRDEGETLVERALAEALFASNENPPPVDYGVSFQEIRVQGVHDTEAPGWPIHTTTQ